ncbi:unnamed protein product [Protopolystoma xenopodis]|uniref:Uncharacterized protein n=1 Tax=Protopolystoma xenopodis TaxID=117903 RepID=A0A448WZL9_9PLAT|nr:unnamed protein product [Protopolystoma xenopodis]
MPGVMPSSFLPKELLSAGFERNFRLLPLNSCLESRGISHSLGASTGHLDPWIRPLRLSSPVRCSKAKSPALSTNTLNSSNLLRNAQRVKRAEHSGVVVLGSTSRWILLPDLDEEEPIVLRATPAGDDASSLSTESVAPSTLEINTN